VGAGYWGPNLIRNFAAHPETDLRWVCDLDLDLAQRAVGRHTAIATTTSLDQVLDDPSVHAVALATPAATHFQLASRCLEAGRHLLVEKPLAATVADGERLVADAAARGQVLMCDHTYCYTPAAQRIRSLIESGALGTVQYLDSVRVNLGLVQPDVDVFWDLAPHDLSLIDFCLPQDRRPVAVGAQGSDPIGARQSCIGYLSLPLGGGGIAHAHVNWLSPTKVRTMMIGGSERMLLWDDLSPSQRISIFDKGIDLPAQVATSSVRRDAQISYRIGDMVAPALPETEALQGVVTEFVAAIREGRAPLTDGEAGLRVLRILETAQQSLRERGATVDLDTSEPKALETASMEGS
jgi:predicted dehydrogenase